MSIVGQTIMLGTAVDFGTEFEQDRATLLASLAVYRVDYRRNGNTLGKNANPVRVPYMPRLDSSKRPKTVEHTCRL